MGYDPIRVYLVMEQEWQVYLYIFRADLWQTVNDLIRQ